jgi:hypothetical protein
MYHKAVSFENSIMNYISFCTDRKNANKIFEFNKNLNNTYLNDLQIYLYNFYVLWYNISNKKGGL